MPFFSAGPTAWSRPVRLLHWLVAGSVILNLFNDTGYAHRMIGYAALVLVSIRIIYGFGTSNRAERLGWPSWSELREHLSQLYLRQSHARPGHNPLGQFAVYLMWLLIGLLGLTGWVSRTDALWGEDWPVDLHAWLSDALLVMVALHITAVFGISWWFRHNLIKSMITSRKRHS